MVAAVSETSSLHLPTQAEASMLQARPHPCSRSRCGYDLAVASLVAAVSETSSLHLPPSDASSAGVPCALRTELDPSLRAELDELDELR
jgi:hypothetical protein